jgi:hypothetical protein
MIHVSPGPVCNKIAMVRMPQTGFGLRDNTGNECVSDLGVIGSLKWHHQGQERQLDRGNEDRLRGWCAVGGIRAI